MTDLPQPTSPPHPNSPLPLGERLSGQTWQTWPETPALNVSDADIAADVAAALASKGAAFDDEVGRALLHHFSIVSPYLMQLVRREPARLARVLSHDPDARFSEILAGLDRAANDLPPNASGFAEGMKLARRAKAEAALLIAVADIGGVWDIGRVTRALTSLERTGDGYVFRTDLRLRPDPGSTPLAIPVEAALVYYEARGQNWERAAMIKAKPGAGDIEAGNRFLYEMRPFVWRKHLDYASIADVHSIKRQIHAHKGHGSIAIEGHNVKLGRGGIREIEFFVQTQQLI
jgi:glutamine synthetase adenylyltransferase